MFRVERRFTFSQVYLNPDKHGEHLARDTAQLLAQLNQAGGKADVSALGDSFLLDHTFAAVPGSEVAKQFGEKFAAKLGELSPGQWQGPVESGYGVHLVFVSERTEGRLPALEEVRDAVRREWANARRLEANEKLYEAMLKRYTVTIERPQVERRKSRGGEGEVKRALLIFVLLATFAPGVFAHEVRPAYLELRQTGPETYDALWKVPGQGENLRLGLYVELPAGCTNVTEPRASMVNNAFTERWTVKRAGGLTGGTIHIAGLTATMTDVLVRWNASTDHASHAAHAVRSVVRGGSRAGRAGGRPHLHRARRRAHPDGHRPSPVRAGVAHHHARRLEAGEDRHRLHDISQHHAFRGDARLRACAATASRGGHRAEHRLRRGGDCSPGPRSRASPRARRGSWRSPSG